MNPFIERTESEIQYCTVNDSVKFSNHAQSIEVKRIDQKMTKVIKYNQNKTILIKS